LIPLPKGRCLHAALKLVVLLSISKEGGEYTSGKMLDIERYIEIFIRIITKLTLK
jgi:hypothetical protein